MKVQNWAYSSQAFYSHPLLLPPTSYCQISPPCFSISQKEMKETSYHMFPFNSKFLHYKKKLNFKNWKHCQFLLCLVTMQCSLHLFLPYSPILRDFSSHPFYKPFPCVKEMHPLISFLRFLFKILIRLKWELRNCYFSNLVENCFFFFLSLIILT